MPEKMLVSLLCLFIPGTGQALYGKLIAASIFISLYFFGTFLFFWNRVPLHLEGVIAWMLTLLSLGLASAFLYNIKERDKIIKIKYLLIYVISFLSIFYFYITNKELILGFTLDKVIGDSMTPTIRNGDVILSDTWHYKKNNGKIGDIILFRRKQDSIIFIKRIKQINKDGSYSVTGDNPNISLPKEYFGEIPHKNILTKATIGIRLKKFPPIIYELE